MRRIGLIICFTCLLLPSFGQVALYVDGKTKPDINITNQEAEEVAQRQLNELIRNGYLFSSVDSIIVTDSLKKIFIYKGERVRLVVDSIHIVEQGFERSSQLANKTSVEILDEFATRGYPFARLSWSDIHQDRKERLHANLNVDPGPFIANDTLSLISPIKTKKKFIQRSLDMPIGEPYDELAYQKIEDKLSRIPFLDLIAKPDIAFSGGQATTYLNLDEKESNSFEGVLGFLPNQRANGNLLLTGYLDLNLGNLFATGKELSLNWQQFAANSQQLLIDYDHPYLFGSNVLIGTGFKLIKQDSTFITRDMRLSVGTYLWQYLRFEGSYNRFVSDLISPEAQQISNQSLADYSTDLYALRLAKGGKLNAFDSYWNFHAQVTFGRKTVNRNPSLPTEFYDSISSLSTIYKLDIHSEWQKILFSRTALFLQHDLGMIQNDQILRNERYRIGGLKSLRGFNENFFYAESFLLSKVELRQYFEQNSFLMIFYDQLVMKNFNDWSNPLGLGVGFSLATTNGLFSFAFALGNSRETSFDVNNTKIHLGYTSKF